MNTRTPRPKAADDVRDEWAPAAKSEAQSPRPVDVLHDLEVIAKRLDVSTKTVRRLIDRGELPHLRVGRLVRVSERDFADYLARSRRASAKKENNK